MDPPVTITIDDSLWPLLLVKFPSAFSNQQQEQYLEQLVSYLRRGEKYVSIMDTHLLKTPTAEQRQRQADFIKEHEALFRQCALRTAGVVTSPLMALVARILIHLKPMPSPYYVASSLPAAATWAAERLELAGLTEPAERVRRHFGLYLERRAGVKPSPPTPLPPGEGRGEGLTHPGFPHEPGEEEPGVLTVSQFPV